MASFLRTYRTHVFASLIGFGLLAARGLSTGRGAYLFLVWDHSRTWVYTAVGAVFLWSAYAMQRVQAERLRQEIPVDPKSNPARKTPGAGASF